MKAAEEKAMRRAWDAPVVGDGRQRVLDDLKLALFTDRL